jgi:phosphoserine phosphatase RsbU/P
MVLIETPTTASQVLRAFDHDAPYLFLGSAFMTVGIVSIGFCALRRRFDALLVWMAIFAGLYGMRLWQEARILGFATQTSWLLDRLRSSVDYLIPIPAFYFFRAAGFLNRGGRAIVVGTSILFLSMFAATFLIGPLHWIHTINDYLVIAVLVLLVVRSIGEKSRDRDFEVVRAGMLCFAAFALWENLGGRKLLPYYLEPYGFAGLLACLGYVAARRTLQRDVELGEIQSELELARRIQLSILPGAFLRPLVFVSPRAMFP